MKTLMARAGTARRYAAPRLDQTTLPRTMQSVREARHWTTRVLNGWGVPESMRETAVLLVSELYTNSVIHPDVTDRNTVTVTVAWYDGNLRVSVSGPDSVVPAKRALPSAEAVKDPTSRVGFGGLGLVILDALADRHGTDPAPGGGKITWFQLVGGPR